MVTNETATADLAPRRAHLWLAAVMALGLALTGTYIYLDRACPGWDQAWYLQVSTQLFYALRDGGLPAFVDVYVHAFTIKAPLVSVLPLPFYALFGPTEDAALLSTWSGWWRCRPGCTASAPHSMAGAGRCGRWRSFRCCADPAAAPRGAGGVWPGGPGGPLRYALWRSDGLRRRGWDLALGALLGRACS
jgi:hypothetical protein